MSKREMITIPNYDNNNFAFHRDTFSVKLLMANVKRKRQQSGCFSVEIIEELSIKHNHSLLKFLP